MPSHRRSGQGLRRTRRSYNLRSIARTSPSPTLSSFSRTPTGLFFKTWRDFLHSQWQVGSESSLSRASSISSARTGSLPSLTWSDFSGHGPQFPTPRTRTPPTPTPSPSEDSWSGTFPVGSGLELNLGSSSSLSWSPRNLFLQRVRLSRSPSQCGLMTPTVWRRALHSARGRLPRITRRGAMAGGGVFVVILLVLLMWLLFR